MKKRSDFENDRRGAGRPASRRQEPGRPEERRPEARRSESESRGREGARDQRGRSRDDFRGREDSRDDRGYAGRPRGGEKRFGSDSQPRESRDFRNSDETRRKQDEKPFARGYDRERTRSKDRDREPGPSDERRSSYRDQRETRPRGRDSANGDRFPGGKTPRSRRPEGEEKREERQAFQPREDRFQRRSTGSTERTTGSRPERERYGEKEEGFRRTSDRKPRPDYGSRDFDRKDPKSYQPAQDDRIRLNRFIANAGICSRREADELIEAGQITVNGKVVNEMGFKVGPADVVKYGKRILNAEKLVYILLNKPKDYITTTDDPEDRRTVLQLIEGACEERVYPVGRLDRNTTGLLLITNDGELADKLTHPSHNIKKVYQAELDKPITLEDFEALKNGVELEDGFVKPDDIGIVTPDAFVVGIEIHSGRNRIVRRLFEHFGYEVKKLDRTTFAGLNKKDLPRGSWRFLTKKEVITLKFLV